MVTKNDMTKHMFAAYITGIHTPKLPTAYLPLAYASAHSITLFAFISILMWRTSPAQRLNAFDYERGRTLRPSARRPLVTPWLRCDTPRYLSRTCQHLFSRLLPLYPSASHLPPPTISSRRLHLSPATVQPSSAICRLPPACLPVPAIPQPPTYSITLPTCYPPPPA